LNSTLALNILISERFFIRVRKVFFEFKLYSINKIESYKTRSKQSRSKTNLNKKINCFMTFMKIILLLGLPGPPRLITGDSKARGPSTNVPQNNLKTGNFSAMRKIKNGKKLTGHYPYSS
jgi:hypothetical protein